ncbi:MAG: hypothetical protein J7K23_02860 [Thermoproteales archaeon]|nr:hypothetical protein [Thermoproteales archaeon]
MRKMEDEYLEIIRNLKKLRKTVWEIKDWLNYPICAFNVCGKEDPPIIITGGAYGMSKAPVYATFELILTLNYERRIIMIPSRDPVGFHSISEIITYMFDTKIENINEIKDIVRENGGRIVIEKDETWLGIIKNVGFFCTDKNDINSRDFLYHLLQKYNLWEETDGIRILTPILITGNPKNDSFHTLYIDNRKILDYDTFISIENSIPESHSFIKFVEITQPMLLIDLEEHSNNMLIKINTGDEKIYASLKLALSQLSIKEENITLNKEKNLLEYARKRNIYGIQIFTSLKNNLEDRINTHITLTRSLINIFGLTYIL